MTKKPTYKKKKSKKIHYTYGNWSNPPKLQFMKAQWKYPIIMSPGYGSSVTLKIINGAEIGSIDTDIVVTAIAMTLISEGTVVNCVFLGMQNGVIRIFMWTMKFVRDIIDYRFLEPIVSISFLNRCTRLFVNLSSGRDFKYVSRRLVSELIFGKVSSQSHADIKIMKCYKKFPRQAVKESKAFMILTFADYLYIGIVNVADNESNLAEIEEMLLEKKI
uniref:Uncharacterized protein n=1 Tax=Wuchereria bancrofti TaxID=6293 RepID=A0A1I8ESM6_WUCBA